jgi:hypothetical protein
MSWAGWNSDWWEKQGTRGGVVAGVIYLVFELIVAKLRPSVADTIEPLRVKTTILLGPEALEATGPRGPAIVSGLIVHLTMASIFGLGFGTLLAQRRRLTRSLSALILAAVLYGLAVWLSNIYAVAPTIGWPWFAEVTEPITEGVGHTAFFGLPLALYFYGIAAPRRRLGI